MKRPLQKMSLLVFICFLFLSLSAFNTHIWAQQSPAYTISGSIKHLAAQTPLQGVLVTANDTSGNIYRGSTSTDSSGNYSLFLLSPATYTLTASKLGYIDASPPDIIELTAASPNETVSLFMELQNTSLSLSAGWNFVSLFLLPSSPAPIETVLKDVSAQVRIVWGYDNVNRIWLKYSPNLSLRTPNTLDKVEYGKGYWVFMDAPGSINLYSWFPPSASSLYLSTGWNLIGYNGFDGTDASAGLKDISGKWSILWNWQNSQWRMKQPLSPAVDIPSILKPFQEITAFNQGRAYWIRAKGAADWKQIVYPDTVSQSDISRIAEIASYSKSIVSADGGTITKNEFTAIFPANALPANAWIKASKVSVLNSTQDQFLSDMTDTYVLSTVSSRKPLELNESARIEFAVNPAGFDETTMLLVVWNGFEWHEVPAWYDDIRRVVFTTLESILPFGTRIYYLSNASAASISEPDEMETREIASEFVAVKVVAAMPGNFVPMSPASRGASSAPLAPRQLGTVMRYDSGNFEIEYKKPEGLAYAKEVGTYLENAYKKLVGEMGLKKPGPVNRYGFKKWGVIFFKMDGYFGAASPNNYIEIAEGTALGDDLAHTCHHEFTHLVQYRTLDDADLEVKNSYDWFNETMADGLGFYAQKGLGKIYSLNGMSMGYFHVRLDSDQHTNPVNNDRYEYRHFPFISYLLGKYGHAKFKTFFESFYSSKIGDKDNINMASLEVTAYNTYLKAVSGREGIFWDFYRDYFIAGTVFNKDNFLNLPNRLKDTPYEITNENKGKQGVTIVGVSPGNDDGLYRYQKEFTMERLSGQVALLRYSGSAEQSMNLSVSINVPSDFSKGRIQLVSYKRVGGAIQTPGTVDEVSGSTLSKTFMGFGRDIHEIYVLMVNADTLTDGYKVTVEVNAFR